MSEMLREGSPLDKHRGQESITDFDRKVFQSISKALWLPDDFKEYMVQYMALNQPPIPISQVFGFAGFTFQGQEVTTNESTSSTSYTDLATVGPEVTGLPDGSYAVFFGVQPNTFAGASQAIASVSVNGGAPSDTDSATANSAGTNLSVSRLLLKTVENNGNNSFRVQYRNSPGTAISYANRWIAAVKYANT